MARAHFVAKARKAHKEIGVKKGESYWWWKFRFGGIHKSVTKPKASQLTQSAFLSTYYDLQEQVSDLRGNDLESLEDAVIAIKDDIESLRDETQDSLDNMPEQLQDGDTGQLLQERIDGLEEWADSLDSLDYDLDQSEDDVRDEVKDDMEQELDEDDEDGIDEDELESRVESKMNELKEEKVDELVGEIESSDPCLS